MNKRNGAVDISKFIAAIFVVAIPTSLFSDINGTLYFLTVHIVCRLAVPFFAICTGYFVGKKLNLFGKSEKLEKTQENRHVFYRLFLKNAVLYAACAGAYLVYSIPGWIKTGWFSLAAFKDYAVATLLNGAHYHLWYLLYLLYMIPLLYLAVRLLSKRTQWVVIVVLWCVSVLLYTYKDLLAGSVYVLLSGAEWASLRFVLLPLMLVGVQISTKRVRKKRVQLIGFCVSFLLLLAEAFALRAAGIEKVSYILFTLPASYFLFQLVLDCKIPEKWGKCASILGESSIGIYCIHPIFIEILSINNSILNWLAASALSILVSCGYAALQGRRKQRGK